MAFGTGFCCCDDVSEVPASSSVICGVWPVPTTITATFRVKWNDADCATFSYTIQDVYQTIALSFRGFAGDNSAMYGYRDPVTDECTWTTFGYNCILSSSGFVKCGSCPLYWSPFVSIGCNNFSPSNNSMTFSAQARLRAVGQYLPPSGNISCHSVGGSDTTVPPGYPAPGPKCGVTPPDPGNFITTTTNNYPSFSVVGSGTFSPFYGASTFPAIGDVVITA